MTIDRDFKIEVNLKVRISKERGVFTSLKRIWKSRSISLKTKVRIFKSNVLSECATLWGRILESN